MSFVLAISLLAGSMQFAVPDTLTLQYCQSRVESHYPLSRKIELQREIAELNKKITGTASYPQLNVGATATYQSEITRFPLQSGSQLRSPELSKDQYRLTMDMTQTIYNGGMVGIRKKLDEIRGDQQQYEVEIQLHQLKEQLNEVFFGIILARQQLEVIQLRSENLRTQLKSIRARVEHGALLPTQQYLLEAELIKSSQDSVEIFSTIRSGYQVLSELIDQPIGPEVPLKIPGNLAVTTGADSLARLRPEFELFESKRKAIDLQKSLAQTSLTPALSAFGTAAYGRPGFNVFENDMHPYYILGLRLQWNFWEAKNAASKQRVYELQKKNITADELAFKKQLRGSLSKIKEKIRFLEDQIRRDEEILKLRERVVEVLSSQFKNGSATATEYITELNNATQARLARSLHRMRLVQAKVEYQTVKGINY